ncbi:MAG TPA: 1,2-phenylacetyl-CoA epoxidase subunit PaaC [Sediminibacterium sp.]|nr:1,2-phenylacetyl-CoA epoxidase subunit PaaC [Sediminibacterium sp.]
MRELFTPKIKYLLHLADNALILAQRNSAWCGHGPILEQDIALTNITLDHLGQARLLYQYTAELIGSGETEDSLAYLRDPMDYLNVQLVELPNGDWGQTILRVFFFSNYQSALYKKLQHSGDTTVAAIAAKSLKEVSYHLRWSSEWVIRLGDGTPESRQRMLAALDYLWPYTGEMFEPADFEKIAAAEGLGINPTELINDWDQTLQKVFTEAGLPIPEKNWMHSGGKKGVHTEHLGYVLAEMQYLQRTYPGSNW